MVPLTRCPHCNADLPAFHDGLDCPECGEELFPVSDEASPQTPPAPAEESLESVPEKKPVEEMSALGSLGISLVIALMLGASFELISHKSAGAMFGNGTAVLITLIGALVIHGIRVLLCSGDRNFTGLGLAFVLLLIGLYTHYDEKLFAARRPWNLVLATLFLGGGAVLVTGFVFALIRMFENKSERGMGKTCLGLGPTGLGIVLAIGWGWRLLYRDKSPLPEGKKDRHFNLMCVWTAGLVLQLAVLGYVWYKSKPGQGVIPPTLEPPITIHTEPVLRNEKGVFHRVRLVNTSDKPIYGMRWAAFTDEEWRVKEDKRRMARWESIPPIEPGGYYDLPQVFDAGWIFEFDAGEQGVKVYKLTGR